MLVILMVVIGQSVLYADYKAEIYHSFINNDMAQWKSLIDEMQQKENKKNDFLWELVNYQYGYIGWCLGNDKSREAEHYLSLAEHNLSILQQSTENVSMIYAYKTAFYGFQIGLNIWKAPLIGSKSIESARQAVDEDPMNPYAYIQLGNIEYYRPEVFGGSKSRALYYYLKARQLMELDQNQNSITGDWNYLGLLTIIANTYFETGSIIMAKKYYERILEIEPDFGWVRDELYPRVLKENNK